MILDNTEQSRDTCVKAKMILANVEQSGCTVLKHYAHTKNMKLNSQRIQINISGTLFETYDNTLKRFPETLLGDITKRDKYYSNGEYFFNRNRVVFESILFFYQSYGRLTRPSNIPMSIFEKECRYFHIPNDAIMTMKEREGFLKELKNDDFVPATTIRQKIWYLLQFPENSKSALVFSLVSLTITVISVALAMAESMPSIKKEFNNKHNAWYILDLSITSWFALEVTVYALVAPLWYTLKRPMTYIDFLSSYPYLIMLIVSNSTFTLMKFFRIFRLIKLLRLLKLFTSTKRADILGRILYSSLPELFLLFLCLMIVVFLGASLIYMMESGTPDSKFTSIPECSWWALQTVVVLGYGDLVPTTGEGKLLAAMFMICGATTLALPVLSVATKFLNIYEANVIN